MLTQENIIFENACFIAESILQINKEAIVKSIYKQVIPILEELKIYSLQKIIIKDLSLFDCILGTARMNSISSTIKLSYQTAIQLSDVSHREHNEGLATLYHEMYHIKDYENIGKQLLHASEKTAETETGYDLWTEFFATYSSFSVCESSHVYESFDSCFNKWDSPINDKKYYLSHLMGYYLNKGHSSTCEQLISKHLCKKYVQQLSVKLMSILEQYPAVSIKNIEELKTLMDKVATNKYDLSDSKEVSIQELINSIRRKQ